VATVRRTRFMRIYEPRWTTTERRCGPLLSTVGAKLRLSRGTRMTNDDWRDDIVVEPPDHMPYSDALDHFFAYRAPDGSNWDGYAPDFELVERNPDGNL
jgi:hypothetical protein